MSFQTSVDEEVSGQVKLLLADFICMIISCRTICRQALTAWQDSVGGISFAQRGAIRSEGGFIVLVATKPYQSYTNQLEDEAHHWSKERESSASSKQQVAQTKYDKEKVWVLVHPYHSLDMSLISTSFTAKVRFTCLKGDLLQDIVEL